MFINLIKVCAEWRLSLVPSLFMLHYLNLHLRILSFYAIDKWIKNHCWWNLILKHIIEVGTLITRCPSCAKLPSSHVSTLPLTEWLGYICSFLAEWKIVKGVTSSSALIQHYSYSLSFPISALCRSIIAEDKLTEKRFIKLGPDKMKTKSGWQKFRIVKLKDRKILAYPIFIWFAIIGKDKLLFIRSG